MIDDQTERAWWLFTLPTGCPSWAPGNTAEDALEVIRRNSYDKMPIDMTACVRSRWASRDAITSSLLRSGAR